MKIQVLVATMHQTDYSLPAKMNIQTDAVIINQCDRSEYAEFEYNGYKIQFISTTQRGLSKSRNMALSYADADADICLLADDDVRLADGYANIIEKAFKKQPKADIMAFNIYMLNFTDGRARREIMKEGRVKRNRYYSSVRLAFRLAKLQKYSLRFNELFGAGGTYGGGEESLLLREARKKGLRFYQSCGFLSEVDCSGSTWFEGFNEKFYFSKGAWLAATYGKLACFYKWYFILRRKKISKLGFKEVNRLIKKGIKEYRSL